MKVLFVIQRWAHFSYHESTIRYLCRNGHEVQVLADEIHGPLQPSDMAAARAEQWEKLTLVPLTARRGGIWRAPVFHARELLSYADYLNRPDQDEFYLMRWRRYLPRYLNRIMRRLSVARRLVGTGMGRSLLRWIIRVTPSAKGIEEYLGTVRPDAVVASPTNMRYSEEAEYIKAGKELGIPTVVPVLSWDNLTTKGLIHEVPDITMVWNRTQQVEAAAIHGIPSGDIVVTGSPFLDKWFENETAPLSEDGFRQRVGLPGNKPFVLYLGSSANIAADESWLVLQLAGSLANCLDPRLRDVQVLVRPHGANQEPYRNISMPNVTVWLRDRELPDSPEAFAEFAAALEYSTCCLGLNTTGMVDALLMDRPVIALLLKEYEDSNASKAVHYRYLLDAGVYLPAQTPDTATELISEVLNGGDPKHAEREKFKLDFIRPHGLNRPAGEVAALAIEMAAAGKTASEIQVTVERSRVAGAVAAG